MNNIDFQNGFVVGMLSAGAVDVEKLDHTVTFTVDGEPYEVVSVKNGNVVNEPTQPTSEGSYFLCWQNNGEEILFPYVPTEDSEVNALFGRLRTNIEIKGANTFVCTAFGTKQTDETAIFGYFSSSSGATGILVGETDTSVGTSKVNNRATFEHNGKTWYVNSAMNYSNVDKFTDGTVNPYYIGDYPTGTHIYIIEASKVLIDYYYLK